MITYMRVLDADQQGALTGVKSLESCCASIQTLRPTARGEPSKATSRVPDG
jgi:hypothetical protein